MTDRPEATTQAAFLAAILIGGANFVAVSMSNMELPPVYGAALRFGVAGAFFMVLSRAMRLPRVRGRAAWGAAAYGLLGFGVAYACLYYALVGLPAGVVAVVTAAAPLFTLLLVALLGQERLTVRGVGGGVLAMAGIGVLSRGALGGDVGASYLVFAVVGAVAIAGSTVVAKRVVGVHPVTMNAIGMVAGTALLAATSLALGEAWSVPREARTLAAVAWLVVLGSVGLFQLFLYVIRRWTASATVYAVAAMPVVAAALGVALLDQPVTAEVVAGGAMVMAAVYVGAIRRPSAPRPATSVAAEP